MEEKEKPSSRDRRDTLSSLRLGVSWACFLLSALLLLGHYLAVESFQSDVAYDGFFYASLILAVLLTLFLLSTFLNKEKSAFLALLECLLQVLVTGGLSLAVYFTLLSFPSFVQAFLKEDVLLLSLTVYAFLNSLLSTGEKMGASLFPSKKKENEDGK